jgi:uncharacterized cupin superfamily protein
MPLSNIVLLNPDGPQGKLEPRPFPMELLASGRPPIQNGYRYIEDIERDLRMSVWDSTPFTSNFHLHPANELFLVIDGSVTIIEAADRQSTFKSGDIFIIPQNLNFQWKQPEYFRKYAVNFKDASQREATNPTALKMVRLDPSGRLQETDGSSAVSVLSHVAVQHERRWFSDPTGQLTVSVWDTTACNSEPRPSQAHEWVHILDGSVILTGATGDAQYFKMGDTFVAPLGSMRGWQCHKKRRALPNHRERIKPP